MSANRYIRFVELSSGVIRDTLNSCSLIPIRDRKRKRLSGYYRRRMRVLFDPELYHQRNKVETVFSVLKRKFGESLKARKYRLQVKEIKIKVILYNLSRLRKGISVLIVIEEFYKVVSFSFYKKTKDRGVHIVPITTHIMEASPSSVYRIFLRLTAGEMMILEVYFGKGCSDSKNS
ncbi:MAG: hypothetical protein A4E35_02311 [Methanoregula sp. PtaU1.Bin051]|nr:MAG: hypothetical protein A4E35_02311 [Methanoregula sp. PtaU1.Bin051]